MKSNLNSVQKEREKALRDLKEDLLPILELDPENPDLEETEFVLQANLFDPDQELLILAQDLQEPLKSKLEQIAHKVKELKTDSLKLNHIASLLK